MSTEVRHRRGTAAQHATFTGAESEFTHDTTNNAIRVHDGSTAGGNRTLMVSERGAANGVASLDSGGQVPLSQLGNAGTGVPSPTGEAGKYLRVNSGGSAYELFVGKNPNTYLAAEYGVKADGVTNDAVALQACVDAAIAGGGGSVILPAGTILIENASLNIQLSTGADIALIGQGSYLTTLRFKGTFTDGINYDSTQTADNQHPQFTVRGFSIRTSKKNAGRAIDARWANGNNIERAFRMEDVVIGQFIKALSDTGADYGYWSSGVYLYHARNSYIRDSYFYGEMNLSPQTATAFEYEGDTVFVGVHNVLVLEATTGHHIKSNCEGMKFTSCSTVGTRNGIYYGVTSGAEPELVVIGCDFNTANTGIWTQNVQGISIIGCTFFANSWLDTGTWPEYIGVLLQNPNNAYGRISGCHFTKEDQRTGDTTTAIDFNGGGNYTVSDTHIYGFQAGNPMTYGVQARSGVTDVLVEASVQFKNVSNKFANLGTRSYRNKILQSGQNTQATGTTITFPQAFTEIPTVIAGHNGSNTAANVVVQSVSTTGFTVNHNAGGSILIDWTAAGN